TLHLLRPLPTGMRARRQRLAIEAFMIALAADAPPAIVECPRARNSVWAAGWAAPLRSCDSRRNNQAFHVGFSAVVKILEQFIGYTNATKLLELTLAASVN